MNSSADRGRRSTTRRFAAAFLLVAVGAAIGRWTASERAGSVDRSSSSRTSAASETPAQIWTCSMHPQIRMPSPGNCPICGMKLVPAKDVAGSGSAVVLSEGAQRVASIEVEPATRHRLTHELRTVGRIEFAEPNVASLTARVAGRVERLYADYTGVDVAKGDHLVDIYSPDLVVAQEELLLGARALSRDSGAREQSDGRDRVRYELAREKLALLGVTTEQIEELEKTGRPGLILTVHAPIGGTVVAKNVREQTYVEIGDPLYDIADLAHVWLLAEVYEFELPWVARGQRTRVTLEALPGEVFEGLVAFVDPRVDEMTRTVKVRINLDNAQRLLKPGMFAHVTIRAPLGADGKRAVALLAGMFTCPMHPEVVADREGTCPLCGMALAREPGEPIAEAERSPALLAVPRTAVLDSGARRIVWIERAPGRYEAAEVALGPRAGDRYPVLAGVNEGDRVVVRGNFLLDSQSQIEGKPSLLFPKGLAVGVSAHAGH